MASERPVETVTLYVCPYCGTKSARAGRTCQRLNWHPTRRPVEHVPRTASLHPVDEEGREALVKAAADRYVEAYNRAAVARGPVDAHETAMAAVLDLLGFGEAVPRGE